ncbi:MAG TPA: response regulator transcription factor [Bryobacteraceae bacterium]|nr:response regulator transcription factor [Bryobacteraceae bacterium]
MIRVVVIAGSLAQAKRLSAMLADDDRLEVVEARASSGGLGGLADVFLVAGVGPGDSLPASRPTVVLSDARAEVLSFGNGLRAWMPMNATAAEIGAAIVAAAHDLVVLTQAQARRLAAQQHAAHPEGAHHDEDFPTETLTARELQVLRMLSDGLGNKEIAGQLGISDHTAKFHVAQILAKLGARSRAEAVFIGIRRGLVPV